ncbi:MAG: hypothetical protein MJ010_06255 [Paludibacteraceae bacterium]|nr:hypothetical protein [Paludibacteraceae bacterium]
MEQEELFKEINSTIANIEAEMGKLKELVQEFRSLGVKELRSEGVKELRSEITESPSPHIDGRLIADLHKAIGLNDRIRFQRELFNGDAELMGATIDFLNAVSSYTEAIKYLDENFDWKDDDETVIYFKEILKRKAYNA